MFNLKTLKSANLRAKYLQEQIETIQAQQERLRIRFSVDTTQGGKRADFTDLLDNKFELLELLKQEQNKLNALSVSFAKACQKLPPIDAQLLTWLYVDGLSIGAIAEKLNYSLSHTQRLKRKAVEHFNALLA